MGTLVLRTSVEQVPVSISIQRGLYRVPAGVYPCIGHKVIVDPVWIRRVRRRQDSSGHGRKRSRAQIRPKVKLGVDSVVKRRAKRTINLVIFGNLTQSRQREREKQVQGRQHTGMSSGGTNDGKREYEAASRRVNKERSGLLQAANLAFFWARLTALLTGV